MMSVMDGSLASWRGGESANHDRSDGFFGSIVGYGLAVRIIASQIPAGGDDASKCSGDQCICHLGVDDMLAPFCAASASHEST